MKLIQKYDKGVAGLDLFLSLVVSLFVIGLIVMIFALMGGGLTDATYTSTGGTATNESLGTVSSTTNFAVAGYKDVVCTSPTFYNATSGGVIPTSNYTVSNCQVTPTGAPYNNTDWNVTYTYSYNADNDATQTIGNTTDAIKGAVDWFDIFIVIGAMVVLILLTVIIIAAIRGSGLIAQGQGTA